MYSAWNDSTFTSHSGAPKFMVPQSDDIKHKEAGPSRLTLHTHPAARIAGGASDNASMQASKMPSTSSLYTVPTGSTSGLQPASLSTNASSNLTEFTKRKNWSQRIIDEIQDFMHVTGPSGKFLFCSPSIYQLAGYKADELMGQDLYDFVHPDDLESLRQGHKKAIADDGHFVLYFKFRKRNGDFLLLEVTGHPYFSSKLPSVVAGPAKAAAAADDSTTSMDDLGLNDEGNASDPKTDSCRCIFSIARPYPSKNVSLLDSFLELRMENERLRKTLKAIHSEDQAKVIASLQAEGLFKSGPDQNRSRSSHSSGEDDSLSSIKAEKAATSSSRFDIRPANEFSQEKKNQFAIPQQRRASDSKVKPTMDNKANDSKRYLATSYPSTRPLSSSAPDNRGNSTSNLKTPHTNESHIFRAPSSGAHGSTSHRSQDNQKSSSSRASEASTASTAALTAIELQKSRKKKKARSEEEDYVCTDCGTVDSPEWRKGPLGSKTLCNACGLRWAKKAKRGSLTSLSSISAAE